MSMSDGIKTISQVITVVQKTNKIVKLEMTCEFEFLDRLNTKVRGVFEKTLPLNIFEGMTKVEDWESLQPKAEGWAKVGPSIKI